mgnify:CR=1 FL=1
MFGYIRPFKPELKIREFETYKAVYCGLCHQLGRSFGAAARLTLSYDFAFFALLYMAVAPECPSFKRCVCIANPVRKRTCCTDDAALSFSADAAAISMYYKVRDNIADGRWWEKLLWRALLPFVSGAERRARKRRPELDEAFAEMMAAQAEAERGGADMDAAAEPTARAMSKMFAMCPCEGEAQRRVLERLGYLIGRYIYLCDAADDLESDIKKRRFNPLKGEENGTEAARAAIYLTIAEAQAAFALMETRRYGEIVENIVSLGLKSRADQLLAPKT